MGDTKRELKGNDILQTMDAREWAKEFMQINPNSGMDEDMMIAWFANAIMCGWDHHRWSTREYKRTVRRIMVPWWKRLFVPLSNYGR